MYKIQYSKEKIKLMNFLNLQLVCLALTVSLTVQEGENSPQISILLLLRDILTKSLNTPDAIDAAFFTVSIL